MTNQPVTMQLPAPDVCRVQLDDRRIAVAADAMANRTEAEAQTAMADLLGEDKTDGA